MFSLGGSQFIVAMASAALSVFLLYLVLYVISLVRRDNTIADIGWGIGFIVAVLTVLWQQEALSLRQVIVMSLVGAWGIRLTFHTWLRARGKKEDWRYARMRITWREHWVARSFFEVYLRQLVFLMIIIAPVIAISAMRGPAWGILDYLGLTVWACGFLFELIADHQLALFRKNRANKGHVLQTGLWRYSRHPNYFGEVMMWWGYWIMAISIPGGWQTIVGPAFITFLILRVSGVPLMEKHFSANPEYLGYQRRTSVFVPWFPRYK